MILLVVIVKLLGNIALFNLAFIFETWISFFFPGILPPGLGTLHCRPFVCSHMWLCRISDLSRDVFSHYCVKVISHKGCKYSDKITDFHFPSAFEGREEPCDLLRPIKCEQSVGGFKNWYMIHCIPSHCHSEYESKCGDGASVFRVLYRPW